MNSRLVEVQVVRHQVIRVEKVKGLPEKAHQEKTIYGVVCTNFFNNKFLFICLEFM